MDCIDCGKESDPTERLSLKFAGKLKQGKDFQAEGICKGREGRKDLVCFGNNWQGGRCSEMRLDE